MGRVVDRLHRCYDSIRAIFERAFSAWLALGKIAPAAIRAQRIGFDQHNSTFIRDEIQVWLSAVSDEIASERFERFDFGGHCRFPFVFLSCYGGTTIQHKPRQKAVKRFYGKKFLNVAGNYTNRDALTPSKVAKTLENEGIKLSDKQFVALYHYVSGMPKSDACEAAGLPRTYTWTLFQIPRVQAAMAAVLDRFLLVDAAPAALRCLYSIVQDEKAAPGVRVSAANSLLDRSGFVAKKGDKAAGSGKEAGEMTADELRAEIARLEAEQEARMKDVSGDSVPDSEPDTSQAFEMFE